MNTDNQTFINKFVKLCTIVEIYTRLTHWSTESYALHKATDSFLSSLLDIQDKFVETYAGEYDIRPNIKNFSVTDQNIQKLINDETISVIDKFRTFKNTFRIIFSSITLTSELDNIKDELLAELNKTIYLLRLK